jgi:hypothetical protein
MYGWNLSDIRWWGGKVDYLTKLFLGVLLFDMAHVLVYNRTHFLLDIILVILPVIIGLISSWQLEQITT